MNQLRTPNHVDRPRNRTTRPSRSNMGWMVVAVILGLGGIASAIVYVGQAKSEPAAGLTTGPLVTHAPSNEDHKSYAKAARLATELLTQQMEQTSNAVGLINNTWSTWLDRGGDVNSAINKAHEGLEAEGIPKQLREGKALVDMQMQVAVDHAAKDPQIHAKLTQLAGIYRESYVAATNPTGSLQTYGTAMGARESDRQRAVGELRTLLAAYGQ